MLSGSFSRLGWRTFFDQSRCECVRREYELALDLRPGNPELRVRIAKTDRFIADCDREEQQHQYHRAQGDVLFREKRYEAALGSYEAALSRPGLPGPVFRFALHLLDEAKNQKAKEDGRCHSDENDAGVVSP